MCVSKLKVKTDQREGIKIPETKKKKERFYVYRYVCLSVMLTKREREKDRILLREISNNPIMEF